MMQTMQAHSSAVSYNSFNENGSFCVYCFNVHYITVFRKQDVAQLYVSDYVHSYNWFHENSFLQVGKTHIKIKCF